MFAPFNLHWYELLVPIGAAKVIGLLQPANDPAGEIEADVIREVVSE
jgi:hypothetical protein